MKISLLKTIILLLLGTHYFAIGDQSEQRRVLDYFNEVVYGSEFSGGDAVVRKWNNDICVYVIGDAPKYLVMELEEVIGELNGLIKPLKIKQVNDQTEASLTLFFGRGDEYASIEPRAKEHVAHNYGLFWVDWDENGVLTKASVYVDIYRAKSPRLQKHLLREELTQALGIMRDSYTHKDSIFYQGNSLVTSYSDIDKAVIKRLYSPDVEPGQKRPLIR